MKDECHGFSLIHRPKPVPHSSAWHPALGVLVGSVSAAPPTEFPNVVADRAGLVLDHRKNHATHSGCTDLREFEAWVLAKELAEAHKSKGNTTLNVMRMHESFVARL